MRNRLGMVLGLLAFVGFPAMASAQEEECTEECWHICLGPPYGCIGYGCISGSQGYGCQAGTYYCMIYQCPPTDPEGFVGPDGQRYYAMTPCGGGAPIIASRVVIELDLTEVARLPAESNDWIALEEKPSPPAEGPPAD